MENGQVKRAATAATAATQLFSQEDLALLKDLSLINTAGHGRGAYWYLRKKLTNE